MEVVEKKVACDRCGATVKMEEVTETLSELADAVAKEMGWNDTCAACKVALNGIVTGKLRNKLVLMVEKGKEKKAEKEA